MEPSGPPAAGSTIVYTALGASDANGVGSSVECLFLSDCPNGMGYVPVTVRQLRARGFTVTHLNLGIPTAVIGRDFQTLGQQYNRTIVGNFIDRVRDGLVVDFVDVTALYFPWVFNLADSAITIGIVLLLAKSLFQPKAGAT